MVCVPGSLRVPRRFRVNYDVELLKGDGEEKRAVCTWSFGFERSGFERSQYGRLLKSSLLEIILHRFRKRACVLNISVGCFELPRLLFVQHT